MSNLSRIVFVLIISLSLNMFGNNIAMSYDDESSSTVSESQANKENDPTTTDSSVFVEGTTISPQPGDPDSSELTY